MRSVGLAAIVTVFGVLVGLTAPAHADAIDRRVKQLTSGDSYKLRLSAALWLVKKRDARAVKALTHALTKDSEHTIRRLAAKYLGKLVDQKTPDKVREGALKALKRAAKKDSDDKVRKSAKKSLDSLKYLTGAGPKVFVNVGKPALGKHKAPKKMDEALQATLKSVVRKKAPGYQLEWSGGRLPTKSQLRRAKVRGYFIGSRIAKLKVKKSGSKAEVQCSLSMRVNPWEGRDGKERWAANQAASATGNGKVTGSNTKRGIADAKRDCVLAVAEQLAEKQVVPFIKRLVVAKD